MFKICLFVKNNGSHSAHFTANLINSEMNFFVSSRNKLWPLFLKGTSCKLIRGFFTLCKSPPNYPDWCYMIFKKVYIIHTFWNSNLKQLQKYSRVLCKQDDEQPGIFVKNLLSVPTGFPGYVPVFQEPLAFSINRYR